MRSLKTKTWRSKRADRIFQFPGDEKILALLGATVILIALLGSSLHHATHLTHHPVSIEPGAVSCPICAFTRHNGVTFEIPALATKAVSLPTPVVDEEIFYPQNPALRFRNPRSPPSLSISA